MGDGGSDVHVMLHVNRIGGLTIAVSENRYLTPIARRTVLSDDGLSVIIPANVIVAVVAFASSLRLSGPTGIALCKPSHPSEKP